MAFQGLEKKSSTLQVVLPGGASPACNLLNREVWEGGVIRQGGIRARVVSGRGTHSCFSLLPSNYQVLGALACQSTSTAEHTNTGVGVHVNALRGDNENAVLWHQSRLRICLHWS